MAVELLKKRVWKLENVMTAIELRGSPKRFWTIYVLQSNLKQIDSNFRKFLTNSKNCQVWGLNQEEEEQHTIKSQAEARVTIQEIRKFAF